MQNCSICGVQKPFSEFYKNRNKPRKDCKSCHEKSKMKSKVGAYGLTLEEYGLLFKMQNNACAICNEKFTSKKNTHIDHDHITNKVRALLCHHCNSVIGFAKDSTQTLKSAILYLNKHAEKETV
jgi:hypothetical protein